MKKLNYILLTLIGILSFSDMQAQDGLPPIIDREILFGNPEISSARLSPDGKFISFIKPYNDVRNIWVKGRYDTFESAKPVTADTERPIRGYFWSRDSKYLLYVQDKGGDENFQVYAVNPSEKLAPNTKVPSARNITNIDGMRAYIMSVPKSNEDIMYIGMNDRDPSWHDLYEVSISTGERKLIIENDKEYTGFYFDLEDKLMGASSSNSEGGTIFYKLVDGNFEEIYSCSVDESCYPVRATEDKNKVYFVTNKGRADLTQFGYLNLTDGSFEVIEQDPEGKVDFGGAQFSEKTETLIATSYTGDKTKMYWKDKGFESDYNFLQERFKDAEVSITSMDKNESMWIIYVNSDTDPGAAYLFRREDKNVEFLYRPRPNLPTEYLAKMTPVTYKSSDGLEIPAYLTVPKGIETKNLPAIIVPHGGPWARDYWGYNGLAQFLANRGYVVLQPNFRGSTGYGKSFLNAGNNEWGQLMQDDLTAGAEYLIEQGYADKDKIGIMGGSYGGYATLAGLTFTPDVYAAGVSIVGPSNLFTLLETIPPYWASFREVFHKRMGDPNTPEGEEQLRRQSPFFHAKNIKAPLLVGQGDNDPRVKTAESDQIVVAMRDLGLPVEYVNFPDEGHGFANPDNNMAFFTVAEKFLASHLGGRYQEDVPDNINEIIDNVTVDIATVTLPEKMTEEMATAELPSPVHMPTAGEQAYGMTIEMGPQKIPMDMTRTIEDGDGVWVITDLATSPMGEIKDVCTIKKKSMAPVSRVINQGPMAMNMEISDTKVTGKMSMQGQDTPIDVDLDSPTFMDGAGLGVTLAALPLKDGYNTIYRVFDPTSQKVKSFRLVVEGSENVEINGTSHDTYKTNIENIDGSGGKQTMWISKDDNPVMVKMTANLPEMGGAKMTIELK